MKTKLASLLLATLITTSIFAQAPQKMSYQSVIRNSTNNLVVSSPIGMRISLLQGTAMGTNIYVETQTENTNENGLVSLEIGTGTIVSGNFSTIDWSAGPYFIKTEIDPTGGTTYTIDGTTQLMSVPYALYAATSGTSGGSSSGWALNGNSGLSANNFIGTIDDVNLKFKVNNLKAGEISSSGSLFYGFQAGNSNASIFNLGIGNYALYNNIMGDYNTATGNSALYSNTTGGNNTAFGNSALYTNTTGGNNNAIGNQSLFNNTSGINNTAVSFQTLYSNTIGINNTAIGNQSLYGNITGNNNTAVGFSANVGSSNLTNATAIGSKAIVNQSNQVQVGNDEVTSVKLGTDNNVTLETGLIKISGGNPGTGKVLTSDANGLASWGNSSGSVVSGSIIKGSKNGDMLVWKDTSWVNIPAPTNAYGKNLVYCDGVPQWGGCLPKVITLEPENVGSKSATLGAAVEDDGGLPVTAYGFIWGENKELTLADSVVKLGVGNGDAKLSFSKFQVNKTYFVKAFATNSAGTAYGAVYSLKTVASKPVVQTVSKVIQNGIVYLEGFISDDGGEVTQVNSFGVAYDTNSNPTTGSTTNTASFIFNGRFKVAVPNLAPGTTYYLRAYASSTAGTGYGQVITYKTPSVKIGENKFGGIVFYVDSTGEHGLVAAPTDHITNVKPFHAILAFDNNSNSLGNGYRYKNFMNHPYNQPYVNFDYLFINSTLNGYNDWWLPNTTELGEMAKNTKILNLSQLTYMSSIAENNYRNGVSIQFIGMWVLKYDVWSNSMRNFLNTNYEYCKSPDSTYGTECFSESFAIRAIRAF